ncbi:MAG: DUF4242 domain-containing protein [Actinomycetota bacterium]|nr:DUF4242 domain-containing protein [Actinomycetota bacterium]
MGTAGLSTYLVEAYLPRTSPGGREAVAARARAAAEEMQRDGTAIRFLRSFFVPDDELWFCFYEARSIEDVAEASSRAELVLGRIQQAVDDEVPVRGRRAAKSKR